MAENFVAQELLASGIVSLYAWQGKSSKVEFVIESTGGVVPLEVKSGRITQSKSLGIFEQKFHPARSYVLSARNIARSNTRNYAPVYAAGCLSQNVLATTGKGEG